VGVRADRAGLRGGACRAHAAGGSLTWKKRHPRTGSRWACSPHSR
jgi:hypothetical protein